MPIVQLSIEMTDEEAEICLREVTDGTWKQQGTQIFDQRKIKKATLSKKDRDKLRDKKYEPLARAAVKEIAKLVKEGKSGHLWMAQKTDGTFPNIFRPGRNGNYERVIPRGNEWYPYREWKDYGSKETKSMGSRDVIDTIEVGIGRQSQRGNSATGKHWSIWPFVNTWHGKVINSVFPEVKWPDDTYISFHYMDCRGVRGKTHEGPKYDDYIRGKK